MVSRRKILYYTYFNSKNKNQNLMSPIKLFEKKLKSTEKSKTKN